MDLHETQTGMSNLRKRMKEAYVGMTTTRVGMNDAREDMHELRETIACQDKNRNCLLDTMTSLLSSSNMGNLLEDQSSGMPLNKGNANTLTSKVIVVNILPSKIHYKRIKIQSCTFRLGGVRIPSPIANA